MTAVVVIPHDVSAFEAALGDVVQTVEDEPCHCFGVF